MEITNPKGAAPRRGVIAICLSALIFIWAMNFIAGKIGLRYLPTLTLASFRVAIAGLIMLPTYLVCLRLPAFVEARAASRRGFSRQDYWPFFYLGFFGVAINQLCFTTGLSRTSVSHASIIVGLGPIYALILATLFRLENLSWRKATGMLIAFVGVGLLASSGGPSARTASISGDIITMTGSIAFALYVVLGKRLAGKYDALNMTAFNHFFGALLILPLAIRQLRLLFRNDSWRVVPWQGWTALLFMAIFSSVLAYVLYFWLLRFLPASQLSAFLYFLPVLATIMSIVWLGERGSWSELAGGGLALAGVYWTESGRTRQSSSA